MVNQCNSVEKITLIPEGAFKFLREASREIQLNNRRDVSFSEVCPDEAAIFCSFISSGVGIVQANNQDEFEFLKTRMEILLIIPKESLIAPEPQPQRTTIISLSRTQSGYGHKKRHHNPDPNWHLKY
jgi:hypothetical protein